MNEERLSFRRMVCADIARHYQVGSVSWRTLAAALSNPSIHATILIRAMLHAPPATAQVWRRLLLSHHGIDMLPGVRIGPGLTLPHPTGIVIGAGTSLGSRATVFHNVTLGRSDGGYPTIGDDVVIFPGAVLVGRLSVGDGARIGVNAFVTHDVPAGGVVAGGGLSVRPRTN